MVREGLTEDAGLAGEAWGFGEVGREHFHQSQAHLGSTQKSCVVKKEEAALPTVFNLMLCPQMLCH